MLEPIFGATGAVVVQYIITLVVILALVALVVWLVRRYAVGGVSAAVRGRMPRLAIVDALVVDNRHRLVLVRRDNVEHLLLIGGATDLLVEPSIVRTRVPQRPGQPAPARTSAQPAAVPPPPPPAAATAPPPPQPRSSSSAPEAGENAIPFPPRQQRPVPQRAARTASARPSVRPAEASDLAPREAALRRPVPEPEPVAPVEEAETPTLPRASRLPESFLPEPDLEPMFGETDDSPSTVPEMEMPAPSHPSAFAPPRHRPAAERAPAVEPEPPEEAPEEPASPPAGPPKVSDLEKEMARLLGEISSTRSS